MTALLLAGCASKPPLLDEELRSGLEALVIAPTQLAEGGWALDADHVKALSTAEGALQGAGGGALSAADLFAGSCTGMICGAAALIWLTGVATGAVVGAVQGSKKAELEQREAARLATLQGSFRTVAESLDVAGALSTQLQQVALSASPLTLAVAGDANGTVILVRGHPIEPHLVLQTVVRNVSLDRYDPPKGAALYSLALFVRYRLVSPGSEKPLYESYVYVSGGPWPFDVWAGNDAQLLLTALDNLYRQIAETVIDDVLRIYRSDDATAPATESGRGYFLDAIYPSAIGKPFPAPEHSIGFGFVGTREISDRQPRLRWSSIPHRAGKDRKKESLDVAQTELRYDVRVFKDGLVVAWADALERPEYRVPTPLETCHGYFWTFRARFVANERTFVTDWSQPYVGWLEPWNSRYPLFPGVVGDRDEPGAMVDRTPWYHRFWVRGPCETPP